MEILSIDRNVELRLKKKILLWFV